MSEIRPDQPLTDDAEGHMHKANPKAIDEEDDTEGHMHKANPR